MSEDPIRYIEEAFDGYRRDPADSDFQRGYLAALAAVYREALFQVIPDDIQKMLGG